MRPSLSLLRLKVLILTLLTVKQVLRVSKGKELVLEQACLLELLCFTCLSATAIAYRLPIRSIAH